MHSYNLLAVAGNKAVIQHLDLMLEGQVAALSSGTLDVSEAIRLTAAMRESKLYREDQNSYLLYPDRLITPFLERNTLPSGWEKKIPRLAALIAAGDRSLIRVADDGRAHFHPDLSNARDLGDKLDGLAAEAAWKEAVTADRAALAGLWEEVFDHHSFTGRSGAMFGFEGLGSIYWHMVSKLLLAVQEVHFSAVSENPDSAEALLLEATYGEVRNGLGFTKTSENYGAFPTDPYSHSPAHAGAQQPGMTGQVKEEILTRMGELGVHIERGCVCFDPTLLKRHEFFEKPHTFEYIDLEGESQAWLLGPDSLAFTIFQVPVCYVLGDEDMITLELSDGGLVRIEGRLVPAEKSSELFARNGAIRSIFVTISKNLQ
jgi:hypothetical protein